MIGARARAPAARSVVGVALAIGAWLAAADAARADVPEIRIEASECGSLDRVETDRLLRHELVQTSAEPPEGFSLHVLFACGGDRIRIVIDEPVTLRRVDRAIPAPRVDQPGRERVLALATSQLVIATWSELFVPARPDDLEPVVRAPPRARSRTRSAAPPPARAPKNGDHAPGSVRVGVLGVAGALDLAAPIVVWGGDLRVGIAVLYATWAFASVGFQTGEVARQNGDVAIHHASAGLGIARRLVGGTRAWLEAAALARAVYVALDGRARDDTHYVAGSTSAIGADASVELAFVLQLGPIGIALRARGGVLWHAPVGNVLGEREVDPNGSWIGAAVEISAL